MLDCRKLAVFAQKGRLRPVCLPDEPEEADHQVVRLREPLARKPRVLQQQIKALLLQHDIAKLAGLAHGTAAAVDALRRMELCAELRRPVPRDHPPVITHNMPLRYEWTFSTEHP